MYVMQFRAARMNEADETGNFSYGENCLLLIVQAFSMSIFYLNQRTLYAPSLG
jgi:hypothetical protein